MTRWASSANRTAAAAQSAVQVTFVDLDIEDDHLYLNNSNVTFEWGGQTWQGIATFGEVQSVSESHDMVAHPVKLRLSGVETNLIVDAMNAKYKDRPVRIYEGMVNPKTLALIDTPESEWEGFMDLMVIEADQGFASIELTCEHWLRIAPAVSRYTDEDQQLLYPNDRFFQFSHEIKDYIGKWGSRELNYFGYPSFGDGPGPRRRNDMF